MSRQYTKISSYWQERKQKSLTQLVDSVPASAPTTKPLIPTINFESYGENIMGSCDIGPSNVRGKMYNSQSVNGLGQPAFENLNSYPMPYQTSNGRISMGNAIQLVMKAYMGFPIFRNAIELLVEFSSTPIHIRGGNAKSRAFVKTLCEKFGLEKLTPQWFREYYRSGNVFLYRFDGVFRNDDFNRMRELLGSKSPKVPIRYVVINPTNVFVENGIITNHFTYVKMLSAFEIERLKNPQTPEEKEMFNSLPGYIQTQIRSTTGIANNYIYIPIDPYRLLYAFYQKQDYEPLATPMGFGILNDIEWKLQLKRVDMALTKTIEHAMLLVTTGAEPDKGGVNPANVAALQNLFKNSTIGRVLVADYTTDAKWVIPDLKELLGPEKYIVVDKDIREGLQSILVGEDKFANAIIKARIFNERLREGRKVFIRDFLQPEINRVCEDMNFKAIPTMEFEDVSLEDDTNLQKLYTRWAELGILTPWELMDVKKTGLLPDKDANIEDQKAYKKMRDDGMYYPLIGASSPEDPSAMPGAKSSGGRPSGSKSPQTTKKMSPIGSGVSVKALTKAMDRADSLKASVETAFCKKLKIKKLEVETHKDLSLALCKAIMVNEEVDKWEECVASYIQTPKEQNKTESENIDTIRIEGDVDEWTAILLNKCKINPPSE